MRKALASFLLIGLIAGGASVATAVPSDNGNVLNAWEASPQVTDIQYSRWDHHRGWDHHRDWRRWDDDGGRWRHHHHHNRW